ncbi:uncharacterized protein LOC122522816 [Polistes fuscatus]|uniref:uncharacterized protein LOC122522816 n=1 Tax=Polistes fuscatus TaxID=30207 RepID=UPI001CA86BDB|nr:uncharacterized protein LOC122522816 [Polistes fuscatus]
MWSLVASGIVSGPTGDFAFGRMINNGYKFSMMRTRTNKRMRRFVFRFGKHLEKIYFEFIENYLTFWPNGDTNSLRIHPHILRFPYISISRFGEAFASMCMVQSYTHGQRKPISKIVSGFHDANENFLRPPPREETRSWSFSRT